MKNSQKGFIGLALIIILAVVTMGGGTYIYTKQRDSVNTKANITRKINNIEGQTSVKNTETRNDSSGKLFPVEAIDTKATNDLGVKKFGSNPAYIRELIRLNLLAIGGGFASEDYKLWKAEESYVGICNGAKTYFDTEVNKFISNDLLNANLGITIEDFRISELICKSDDSSYVITIPLTLKGGVESKLCVSHNTAIIGKVDFESLTCIK